MQSLIQRVLSLVVSFLFVTQLAAGQPPSVQPRIVDRIDENKRVILKGNTHPLARAQFDRGAAPANLPMKRMLLVLKRSPEQERALRQLLDDQQDKASPSYHRWLTPAQFGKQFGPAAQDIETVKSWLEPHGFEIGNVAKGGNLIEFSGAARQVQEAFHTSIHKYVVNGEEHWANANDPEIPAALAPVVAGIHTLHDFLKKPMVHVSQERVPAQLVKGKDGKPQITFPGPPVVHAMGPADFASIYNVNPLYNANPPIDGTGTTIAVVARTQIYNSGRDVYDFRGIFGIGGGAINFVLNGPDPGDLGGGEEVEATLDTSWASAVAHNTAVQMVISASTDTTDGVDLSEAYIIDNNLAPVMTESFGSCEAFYTSAEADGFSTMAEQAAAQGITYLVSTGDSGAEGCDNPNFETVANGPLSVNILASTPFNLAVGGTIFNENGQDTSYWSSNNDPATLGSALGYIPENVWNESCLAADCGSDANILAGGGGASTFFAKPSWQTGVTGIPNDGARDIPDVSLTAALHDPYVVCFHGSCQPDGQGFIYLYFVGGTSASAPSFASIMALVNQKMGQPQGQAGYVLYKLAASEDFSKCNGSKTTAAPASTCIFNDVTVGNNAVPGEPDYESDSAKYQSTVGYDLATGLGSVNVTNLVNKWNTATFTATTTAITNVNPTSITHGQAVSVTVSVVPNTGGGVPTGDISLLTSGNQVLGPFPLSGGSASPSIESLPGGTYTLTARYAGDASFAPSNSTPSPTITVSAEPSTTTLKVETLDNNFNFIPYTGAHYGTYMYFRTDVAGQSGQGHPTGAVDIVDNVGDLNLSLPLNGMGNAASPNYLNSIVYQPPLGIFSFSAGPHSVTANYLFPDQSFNSSFSAPVNFTVSKAPTNITFTPKAGDPTGMEFSAFVNTHSGGNSPSGSVTFYVNGVANGNLGNLSSFPALVGPTGVLIGTTGYADTGDSTIADGTYTVKVVYPGDQNYLSSSSAEVQFTLQPDFRLESNGDTIQVVPGRSGALPLIITALDRYKGTISFDSSSCRGLPSGATCSFSPTSITGSGTTTLTVSTTGVSAALLRHGSSELWAVMSGFGLVGIIFVGIPLRRRRSSLLIAAIACFLLMPAIGCGGGSTAQPQPTPPPSKPTPAGTYTITVNATSGTLKHKLTFTLIVT